MAGRENDILEDPSHQQLESINKYYFPDSIVLPKRNKKTSEKVRWGEKAKESIENLIFPTPLFI